MTVNGRTTTEVGNRPDIPIEDELRHRIALLDGLNYYSLWLWRLPDEVPFDQVDLGSGPTEYMQCAGGQAGRFTCDVRLRDETGAINHLVVGRTIVESADQRAIEEIPWDGVRARVRSSEVLTREEVADLFLGLP